MYDITQRYYRTITIEIEGKAKANWRRIRCLIASINAMIGVSCVDRHRQEISRAIISNCSFELERQEMTTLSPLLKNTVDGPKLMEEYPCRRFSSPAHSCQEG
jgi:hypothetical protein